jgi:hypothetical protein
LQFLKYRNTGVQGIIQTSIILPDAIHEEMKEKEDEEKQISDDNEPSKKTKAAAVVCALDLNEMEYGPKENVENVNFGLTTEDCSSLLPG